MKRRNFLYLVVAGLAALVGWLGGSWLRRPAPAPATPVSSAAATGAKTYEWRLITSWPAGAPGTGTTAERLARRLEELSAGRLRVTLYAAGELVDGLEVFDAVARGTAELGHSASFFWQGKTPLAAFFTAVPFGLNPQQHHSWLYQGGGQELWDELYEGFGLKPFAAGNTGPSLGGWFRRPLDFTTAQPFSGIRFRMPGLGGEVVRQLGAVPISLPPSEVFTALESGVIDAAELLAAWNDQAFGLHRIARYCYYPGFHEPNGSAELLVNLTAYQSLPTQLQQVMHAACVAENLLGLSESFWFNAQALEQLREAGVRFVPYPQQFLTQLREVAEQVVRDAAAGDNLGRRLEASYAAARTLTSSWAAYQLR